MLEQFMRILPEVSCDEDNFEEDVGSSTDTDESNSSNSVSHSIIQMDDNQWKTQ